MLISATKRRIVRTSSVGARQLLRDDDDERDGCGDLQVTKGS